MEPKCDKCDREFKEEEARMYPGKIRVHKGVVICEDCLLDMGVSLDETDPWSTYVQTRMDLPPFRGV